MCSLIRTFLYMHPSPYIILTPRPLGGVGSGLSILRRVVVVVPLSNVGSGLLILRLSPRFMRFVMRVSSWGCTRDLAAARMLSQPGRSSDALATWPLHECTRVLAAAWMHLQLGRSMDALAT